jgi:glucosylceramidase
VAASATDNVGVTGVQFVLDGAAAGPVLTVAPYEIPFDTTAASNGAHTIAARAVDAAGNAATSATVTVTVANGGNITRIDQDNAAVSYAGTWVRDEQAVGVASGGTFSESNAAGATVTVTFTGTEVRWLGFRYNGGGIARVLVDGTFEGEVNTYSASPVLGEVFRASGLSAGSHTLTIEVTGTADPAALDSWVIVDAFDVVVTP